MERCQTDLVELYLDGKVQNNFKPQNLCGFEIETL